MKTKIQFATMRDFIETLSMVNSMNFPEWNTTIESDDTDRIITFDGMDEHEVLVGCFCLRTCLTKEEAWVVR